MPPEPLPWDRKDFFKDRKHERAETGSLGPAPRWREPPPPHHGARNSARWNSGDFRRPLGQGDGRRGRMRSFGEPVLGHGKQGGWHLYPEEHGRGFSPSRSAERMLEDDSCRFSASRGDGKYSRTSRESRGGWSEQKDWKGRYPDASAVSSSVPSRQCDVNDQRSVDDMLTYTSHPHSDFLNTWDQLQSKNHPDKMGTVIGLGTGQRSERESSLGSFDWRPWKLNRSGRHESCRGSGFGQSSMSKSVSVDATEAKAELQLRSVTPVQSPSGDAVPYTTSVAPSDEMTSRKKQRLGWGEGLAKYEKKKVEGPDETLNRSVDVVHSLGSNLAIRSPKVTGLSDCASPATPSSVACSSSPGMEDKPFTRALTVVNDTSNLNGSPGSVAHPHLEECTINLERVDSTSITNLSSIVAELVQSDHFGSAESTVTRSALNKLQSMKGEILKALEMTEFKIDQLENELKSLNEFGCSYPCAAASSSLQFEGKEKSWEGQVLGSDLIPRPSPLQIIHGSMDVDKMNCSGGPEQDNGVTKDDDIDSPGTATSKFVQPALGEMISPLNEVHSGECFGNLGSSKSRTADGEFSNDEGVMKLTERTADNSSDDLTLCTNDNALCEILATNKRVASQSCEVFNKLLPKDQCRNDLSEAFKISCRENDALVGEKLIMRRRFLRFKERAVSLKYRTFLRLWKEDMRLLSIKKNRAKSHKKIELISRVTQSGHQKHRSSTRSRNSSHGYGLVSTTEILNFASKLLMDAEVKIYRNSLKMPAQILDKKEKLVSKFVSSNGLVEDPCAVEMERAIINPWTAEEKEIFMDKFSIFGKDFRKIASFIDHKTTADCVEFYYKNHKSETFAKSKKKLDYKKHGKTLPSNTYLLTSGQKWSQDFNAASLDMLGAASVLAARADENMERQRSCSGRFLLGYSNGKKLCNHEKSNGYSFLGNDKEAAAADVLAGICGSLSTEAMSSCITSSVDPGDSHQEWKCQKVGPVSEQSFPPEIMQSVNVETCSDESCRELDSSDWTDEEKSVFLQAVSCYGRDFAMISQCVRTRSKNQCRVFFSKARKCLGLDLVHPVRGIEGTPMGDNGNGSDTDDACAVETDSVICSDKSGSKMEFDLPSVLSINHDDSDPGGSMGLQTDMAMSEEQKLPGNTDFECLKSRDDSIFDECGAERKPGHILNPDVSDTVNRVGNFEASIQEAILSPATMEGRDEVIGESVCLEEPLLVCEQGLNHSDVVNSEVADVSVEDHRSKLEKEKHVLLLKDTTLIDRQDAKGERDTNKSGQSGFPGSLRKSKSVGDTSILDTDSWDSSSDLGSLKCQPNVWSESNCKLKSPAIALPLGTSSLAVNGTDQDPALKETREKHPKDNPSRADDNEQDDVEGPSGGHVKSCQIRRDCSSHIAADKKMNVDEHSKRPPEFSVNKNMPFSHVAQECYLQRCSGSRACSSEAEMQLLCQNVEQSSDHPRVHARSLSDTEKSSRNGDVKLFGQILRHPSCLQKANVSMGETESKGAHQPKFSSKSFNVKFNAHRNVDGKSISSKFDQNNYLGLENLPVRSYGFWDGNRIQTGFPALPDSAILLAKYPAAFGNYATPASKMDQQPLQAVVKGSEQSLNGVPLFSTSKLSSGAGLADFQVYRSRDCTKVAPFLVDMKQRQDIYSEVPRQNGVEAVSSLQQQARAMVGMNVVGRGGFLVGGSCTGVSDPVAAIKMHYAKTDQLGQVGSVIREDTWREKGDVGR